MKNKIAETNYFHWTGQNVVASRFCYDNWDGNSRIFTQTVQYVLEWFECQKYIEIEQIETKVVQSVLVPVVLLSLSALCNEGAVVMMSGTGTSLVII